MAAIIFVRDRVTGKALKMLFQNPKDFRKCQFLFKKSVVFFFAQNYIDNYIHCVVEYEKKYSSKRFSYFCNQKFGVSLNLPSFS